MEPITWVLGCIAISAITIGVTKSLNNNKLKYKVDNNTCNERRMACGDLNKMHFETLESKIDNIAIDISDVKKLVRGK